MRFACIAIGAGVLAAVAPASFGSPLGYTLAFQTTVSGPSALPSACQANHDALYPQLITYAGAPSELTAVYEQDSMNGRVAATSTDGGQTWTRSPIPAAMKCSGGPATRENTQNPSVAGGAPGEAYYGESFWNNAPPENPAVENVVVESSSDGGTTWNDAPSPPGNYSTDVTLAGDPDHPGLVHATWSAFTWVPNAPVVTPALGFLVGATSHDGGKTFSRLTTIYRPTPDKSVLNIRLAREPDGSLLDVFEVVGDANGIAWQVVTNFKKDSLQPLQKAVYVTRSFDGGATWSRPTHVGDYRYVNYGHYNPGPLDLATGPGNRAVLAWSELASNGIGTIKLATSSDGGTSWGLPFTAFTAPGNAFEPAISISASGDLGLFWYDLTDDTPGGDTLADAWFATSSDGGHTWSKTLLAGPFSIEQSVEPSLDGTYDDGTPLGFYQDVAAVGSGFGVAYTVGPPIATGWDGHGRTDVRFARFDPT